MLVFFVLVLCVFFFFFKQKTAYEMRISDWSSDVCSSDLPVDADGNVTNNTLAGAYDLQLPTGAPSDPTSALVNVSIGLDGLVTATFANGEGQTLGKVAMATFPKIGRASGRERVGQYV